VWAESLGCCKEQVRIRFGIANLISCNDYCLSRGQHRELSNQARRFPFFRCLRWPTEFLPWRDRRGALAHRAGDAPASPCVRTLRHAIAEHPRPSVFPIGGRFLATARSQTDHRSFQRADVCAIPTIRSLLFPAPSAMPGHVDKRYRQAFRPSRTRKQGLLSCYFFWYSCLAKQTRAFIH